MEGRSRLGTYLVQMVGNRQGVMTEGEARKVEEGGDEESSISSLSAALVQIDPFAYPDTASRLLMGYKAHNKVLATLLLLPALRIATARHQLRGLLAIKAISTFKRQEKSPKSPILSPNVPKSVPIVSRIDNIYQRLYEEADRKRAIWRQSQVSSESARGTMTSSEAATNAYEELCHSARLQDTRTRGKSGEREGNAGKRSGNSLHSSLSSISVLKEESGSRVHSTRFLTSLPNTSSVPTLKPTPPVHHKLFSQSSQMATKLRKEQLEQEARKRVDSPFVPRVNVGRRGKSQGPAYVRLYEMGEALRKRMEVRREEGKGTKHKASDTSSQEDPRYERLYLSAKDQRQKQADLRAKVNFEEGVSFTPQTNHSPAALYAKPYSRR